MGEAELIRDAREQKGWDQKQLAVVLGVSPQYMSDLERGNRPLNPRMARKLEIYLEPFVEPGALLWKAVSEWLGAEHTATLKAYLETSR